MMTALNEDVIDLTNSFTLACHHSLEGVVIDLESDGDNSGIETKPPTTRRTLKKRPSRISIHDLCTPENKVKKKAKKSIDAQKRKSDEHIKKNEDMDLKNCCPICFDAFGRNPLASTKCGHVFCHKCIMLALKNEPKCPNCRTKLKGAGAVHPIYI